mmetsp:Transcript_81839/g.226780  ORF Transcript_81839/g.226780 Transcript_81839/m.226780 type:complete len:221 (+) Transcript_81839:626-1288(+)
MRSFPPPVVSNSPYRSTSHSQSNPFSLNALLNATLWPSRSVSTSVPSQSQRRAPLRPSALAAAADSLPSCISRYRALPVGTPGSKSQPNLMRRPFASGMHPNSGVCTSVEYRYLNLSPALARNLYSYQVPPVGPRTTRGRRRPRRCCRAPARLHAARTTSACPGAAPAPAPSLARPSCLGLVEAKSGWGRAAPKRNAGGTWGTTAGLPLPSRLPPKKASI